MNKKFILVSLFLISLTGCPLQTREEIAQQDDKKAMRDQVNTMQKQKADAEYKYNEIQTDVRALSGRVEAIEHNSRNNQGGSKAEIDQLRKTIDLQNEKIKAIEQHIEATETRLLTAIQSISAPTSAPVAAKEEKKSDKKSEKSEKSDKGEELFNEAEGLYGAKEFKKAIVKYEDYRASFPKGSKNPESTYKIGVCFEELGMKKDAKEFYQEVVEKFPSSKSSKKAKYRLSNLK